MFKPSSWIFGIVLLLSLILSAPGWAAEPQGSEDLTEGMNIPGVVAKINGVELRSDYIRFRVNVDIRRIGQNLDARQKAKLAETIIEKEIVRELMYQEGQNKIKRCLRKRSKRNCRNSKSLTDRKKNSTRP